MKRVPIRILLYGLAVALLGGVGYMLWHVRERETTIFTDAGVIRVPEGNVIVRDVLWHPAGTDDDVLNGNDDEYAPRVTADGTTMLFVRGRAASNADIYISRRDFDGWSEPEPLEAINTEADELGPEPSPDGRQLYFYSNRAGGRGGYDLWVADRTRDGWGEPRNLGPAVNSRYHEYGVAVSFESERLYFASNRPRGTDRDVPEGDVGISEIRRDAARRDYDLYTSRLSDGVPGTPIPVEAINTAANEVAPATSQFGDFLYFSSDRDEGFGGFDVYRSRRVDGVHRGPLNLGEAINTDADEMDPSVSQGGFTLHFSSNRRHSGGDGEAAADYDLYTARSKEVFREMEAWRAAIEWSGLWRIFGPLLAYVIVAVFILFLMIKMQKQQARPLTLVVRCVLGSVLLHAIILMCLSAVEVSTSLAGMIKPGGATRVMITSPSVGQTLAGQIRGGLTQLESQMIAESSAERQQTEVTETVAAEMAQMQTERASIQTQSTPQTHAAESARDATVKTTQRVEMAAAAESTEPVQTQIEVPVAPTPIDATEMVQGEPTVSIDSVQVASAAEATLPDPSSTVGPTIAVAMALTDLESHPVHTTQMAESAAAEPVAAQTSQATDRIVAATRVDAAAPTQVSLPQTLDASATTSREATVTLAAPAVQIEHRESLARPQAASVSATTVAVAPTAAAATTNAMSSLAPAVEFTPIEVSAPQVELSETDFVPMEFAAAATEFDLPDAGPETIDAPAAEHTSTLVAVAVALAPSRTEFRVDTIAETVDFSPGEATTTEMMTSLLTPLAASTADVAPLEMVAVEGDPFLEGMNLVEAFDDALPTMEEQDRPQTDAVELVAMPIPDVTEDARRAALPDLAFDEPGGPKWFENRVPLNLEPPEQVMLAELEPEAAERDPIVEPKIDPYVEFDPGPTAIVALLDLSIPVVEAAPSATFAHRAPEVRRRTLVDRGGSLETERAVSLALRWLARHQSKDGSWSGKDYDDHCGKCEGPSKVDADTALTGLSVLCFLAADHPHNRPGQYQQVVQAGLAFLVEAQKDNGSLMGTESMYSHGIASIALAEAYGMTGDPQLEEPVQKAIDFIYEARNRSFGGWRYEPGQVGDTSVLGWQIMALISARKAGIDVPDEAFEVAAKWLGKVRDPWKPGLYAYQPKRRVTPSMTAEAMFVNQMLGNYEAEEMKASAEYVVEFLPDWKRNTNTYFWYYATLALFQQGGEEWQSWNEVIKNELLAHQSTRGGTAGSWYPSGKWANVGGRVYQTALCCLTLEVYYRYLPAYVDQERVSRVAP